MALETWWLKAIGTLYSGIFEMSSKGNLSRTLGSIHQVSSRGLIEFRDHVHMYYRKRNDIDTAAVPGHIDKP